MLINESTLLLHKKRTKTSGSNEISKPVEERNTLSALILQMSEEYDFELPVGSWPS